jgi:hypothetical protein
MIANKIQHVSNVKNYKIKATKPYLAISGNIGDIKTPQYTSFIDCVCKDFDRVFFVPGIHDYLSAENMKEADEYFYKLQKHNKNLEIMNDKVCYLENHKIVGSVMWPRIYAMPAMYEGFLFNLKDGNGEYMTPTKINRLHRKNTDFLLKELLNEKSPIIVITHFSPTLAEEDASNPNYLPKYVISNRASNMPYLFTSNIIMWLKN